MVCGAVETQVNAERHAGPRRVFRAAVEADLVGFPALQFVEDAERFAFGRERHDDGVSRRDEWWEYFLRWEVEGCDVMAGAGWEGYYSHFRS